MKKKKKNYHQAFFFFRLYYYFAHDKAKCIVRMSFVITLKKVNIWLCKRTKRRKQQMLILCSSGLVANILLGICFRTICACFQKYLFSSLPTFFSVRQMHFLVCHAFLWALGFVIKGWQLQVMRAC